MSGEWEYITRSYRFFGPDADDWPGRGRYVELLEEVKAERRRAARGPLLTAGFLSDFSREPVVRGPEGDSLIAAYIEWLARVEVEYLNEFGAVGFELVTVYRNEITESRTPKHTYRYAFPDISVVCYLKRPKVTGAADPPKRKIGFHPRDKGPEFDTSV